jgi:hypothetical protein
MFFPLSRYQPVILCRLRRRNRCEGLCHEGFTRPPLPRGLGDSANEHLGRVNRDVWVADKRDKVDDNIPLDDPIVTPLSGHANMVDRAAVDQDGPDATGLTRFSIGLPAASLPIQVSAKIASRVALTRSAIRPIAHSRSFSTHAFEVRGTLLDLAQALVVYGELEGGRALGTEGAAIDRAVGIPLDTDDLAVADADDLGSSERPIGADACDLARP